MEPLLTPSLIAKSLATAALTAGKKIAGKAIVTTREALKSKLIELLGVDSDVLDSLERVESKPESETRQNVLAEELDQSGVVDDQHIKELCLALLEALKESGNTQTSSNQSNNSGDNFQFSDNQFSGTTYLGSKHYHPEKKK